MAMTRNAPAPMGHDLKDLLSAWQDDGVRRRTPAVDPLVESSAADSDVGPPAAGDLAWVDVEAETGRMRWQQVGRTLAKLFGESPEGQYLDEMPRGLRGIAESACRTALTGGSPHHSEMHLVEGGWIATFDRLVLPFRDASGDRIVGLLVAVLPRPDPRPRPDEALAA